MANDDQLTQEQGWQRVGFGSGGVSVHPKPKPEPETDSGGNPSPKPNPRIPETLLDTQKSFYMAI